MICDQPKYRLYFLSTILLLTHIPSNAQQTPLKKFCTGIVASSYLHDPAIGTEVLTPRLWDSGLRLHVRGNLTWMENYVALYRHWATYGTFKAGVNYSVNILEQHLLYFEGGTTLVTPSRRISAKKNINGYYTAAGIELFISTYHQHFFSYYFESSYTLIHAQAEKMDTKPSYAKGFAIATGLRLYF
jgi:hypothetical protein